MGRRRVLVTGFGPFPGAPVNPSGALALQLARSRRLAGIGLAVDALVLPTLWVRADALPAELAARDPDILLMIGLAGRRRALTPERFGRKASRAFPDAAGRRPQRAIQTGAPALVPAPARLGPLVKALREAGLPARLSVDAGGYICNALAWRGYRWARERERTAVFVHIPRPRPGAGIADMRRGLEAVIRALITEAARP
ncbi:peptidase C15 [Ancylobacter sp. 6x-1]|uniref:Pyroglutamyl-peptidase I n=1 Tax=Ancylobacter crimeensis TaxID=2579147 RepID=A0ABT0D8W4_9HYPH|nr:peptidase C15 [Ancylobacter crimeensis]MCK0196393.1 peptidase C15 [Ancylobacter crimeensis]